MALLRVLASLTVCLALCRCNTGSEYVAASVEIEGGTPGGIYVDQTFVGEGCQRFEGRQVVARIGSAIPGERTGYGRTQVYVGSFRIEFPAVRELGLYKSFVFFFDMDGDGVCTPGQDLGFRSATGGGPDPYVIWIQEEDVSIMDAENCRQFP